MMTEQEKFKSQAGVTLIELMIGLVVGLIVLSGIGYAYIVTFKSSRDIIYSARLNQELAAVTSIIVGDIRRAGHWRQGASDTTPFDDIGEDIIRVSSTCLLYSYDADEDGSNVIGADELRGVKLDGGAIWLKASGGNMTACNVGTWEAITDLNFMTVTGVSFADSSLCKEDGVTAACPASMAAASGAVASVREIDIQISAQVNNDSDWQATVQESVRIRNDFFAE